MVWDNLQSTTPVKALPIIDDIGAIVGVFMRNKGSRVNKEAKVRAQFTCNEPEGGGATFRPNIIDGGLEKGNVVDSVTVLTSGIGYGFDPADTFCPKEQYAALVPKAGLVQYVKDGDILMLSKTAAGVEDPTNPDILEVVDTDHDDNNILIATIDPKFNPQFEVGTELMTKDKHKFILNFQRKFPDLIVPGRAKAVYANCGDLIPVMNDIKPINVGRKYVNPVITIGSGAKEQVIGTFSVDAKGRLVEPTITNKVLGFVKPKIRDLGTPDQPARGTGGSISVTYTYTGPRKIRETGMLDLQTYIDCVGHPMLK